jgi:hypothetical protein
LVKDQKVVEASGTIYVNLHLTSRGASRVWINNPPIHGDKHYPDGDPLWDYSKLVDAFGRIAKRQAVQP